MCTPGFTTRRQRGLPRGTRHSFGVQKTLFTAIASVVIMFNPDITRSTSAVLAGVLAERITRKDAHRWRSLPNTPGSMLHPRFSVAIAPPGEDWLPTPKAGRDPPVCGRSWIWPWIGTIACWRWVAQPCGAAPVRSHGSNE